MTFPRQLPGYGPPTPVPIYQWEREFETVLELFRRLPNEEHPKTVLEVGTYHGGTLYHWLQGSVAGDRIVAVDSYQTGIDNRHLYEEWTPKGVDLQIVVGDSRDPVVLEEVALFAPYDWAFIDAGHYYGEVKADWENYGPMVSLGGTVVFHDILPPTRAHPEIEVAQLWEEIKKDHMTLEVVADRGAPWGGIGIVLL